MKKEHYFNIVTPDGYIVCDNLTLSEAAKIKKELNELDKKDGTWTPEFYKIVRVYCL